MFLRLFGLPSAVAEGSLEQSLVVWKYSGSLLPDSVASFRKELPLWQGTGKEDYVSNDLKKRKFFLNIQLN